MMNTTYSLQDLLADTENVNVRVRIDIVEAIMNCHDILSIFHAMNTLFAAMGQNIGDNTLRQLCELTKSKNAADALRLMGDNFTEFHSRMQRIIVEIAAAEKEKDGSQ